jgi:hypothetical protein
MKLHKTVFSNNLLRQTLNSLFALTQFFVPFFSQLTGIGQSIEAQAGKDMATSPEVPAGYAFSIWFAIFVLSVIYAVYQALPSQRENQLFKRIGWWTAAAFFLSTAWMLIVQIFGDGWLLAVIIILMLISTLRSFLSLTQDIKPLSGFDRFIMAPLLGLFSGWLSIAAFLNTASVLKASRFHTFGLSIDSFAIITLIAAAIMALAIIVKTRGNLWYGGTILWALTAVIVANTSRTQNMLIMGFAVGLTVITIVTLLYSRKALNSSISG